jgi:hypothetical protein
VIHVKKEKEMNFANIAPQHAIQGILFANMVCQLRSADADAFTHELQI